MKGGLILLNLAGSIGTAVAAAALLLAPTLGAQQVFRAGTQAVLVDVLVTDRNRPVAGLTTADFELRDNGVRQTIDSVSIGDMPMNAVLSLDMSASTAGPRLEHVRAASEALLAGLRDGDRVALTTFNAAVAPRVPLTGAFDRVRRALADVTPVGETAILDGIFVALMTTQREVGRAIVLLLTDGRDTSSWLDPDELLDSAKRSNAVVYSVASGSAKQWAVLRDLADVTGGRVVEVESSAELHATVQRLLDEFRSRYVITFTPRDVSSGGFHRLDVRTPRGNYTIRARPGYFGGGGNRP